MNKNKLKNLRKHAKDQGYSILEQETERIRNMVSNSTITIRIPNELKDMLKTKAMEMNIPYQRYIKSVLIDSLKKTS